VSAPPQIADIKTESKTRKRAGKKTSLASGGLLLKLTLLEAPLPVWRQIQIPAQVSLSELHHVIQLAMGWQNAHLWEFSDGHNSYMPPSPFGGMDSDTIDPDSISLGALLSKKGDKLLYTYDMGDSWEHLIEVIKVLDGTI
jgi:hypothetical protein